MIVENLFCFLLLEKKRDGSDCYGRIGGEGEIEKNKIMKEEEKEKNVKIIMKVSTVSEEEKVTF